MAELAGKLISKDEASKLTRNFSHEVNGKNYYFWSKKLVLELLSQPEAEHFALFQGYDEKGVPCFVFVALDKEGLIVGDMALEFGSSCPPSCFAEIAK